MIALTPDGNPFLAGGQALTFGAAAVPVDPPVDTGSVPTANLAGWWDASSLGTLGASTWSAAISVLPDRSSAGKNASTNSTTQPRQAGLMGGLFLRGNEFTYAGVHPAIGDFGVGVSGAAVGSGGAFTLFLVWSRANCPQNNGVVNATPVTLISIGGVPVLGMTSKGDGTDTLTLFPNGTAQQVGVLERRHTHSARLVFSGANVDVWLDGTKVLASANSTVTFGATANLAFVSSAQLIFHEAAAWSKTLSSSENATLTGYAAAKWPLGPRRAANGVLIGQSNANNLLGSFNLWIQVNRAVSYMTGCISSNLLWRSGSIGSLTADTVFSGTGVYNGSAGWILNNSAGGDPSTWPLGTNGATLVSALANMTADQRANLRYLAWYWSESPGDLLVAAKKAEFFSAMKRVFSLLRAAVGMTAAQLPILVIDSLPFTTDEGCRLHREVMTDLVADSTQNVRLMLGQAGDAIGQGDSWDASTGLETGGGNTAHRDDVGALAFIRRMAAPIARAVVAANAANGTPDALTAIDASIPVVGGPKVASALRENGTSVLVTLTHDGGNDIAVPLRAAQGVGWSLKDGATVVRATACARVSATQVRLTFPNVSATALLYYNYGSNLDANGFALIGRGNAVTDNFASMTLAAGWRVGADRGVSEQPNNPAQSTAYGVPLN